ncbi:MAG: alpha/beta fold hydrolase [Methanomicrobiales archaeon]|nr:alpha/beta fold hydrolase [Methanomicrobiales archaeon]
MNTCSSPAVLVHGWKSSPAVWKKLASRLAAESIPCWNFDFSGMGNVHPAAIAQALQQYIAEMRAGSGYRGPVDIISHSTGGFIVRYMLEVLDGKGKSERVRQFIALGPPNNGSAMAELFNDPVHGKEVLATLAGVFVPRKYNPAEDLIVQALRPASATTAELRSAGTRGDILYRMIVTENRAQNEAFFPPFQGRTWEYENGRWHTSYAGDGVISHADARLPGAGLDVLPADPDRCMVPPQRYCHIMMPANPEIIDRIVCYLQDPATAPHRICE